MNTQAVVTVGDGRGFIVSGERERFIITAAHCLPGFPPCCSFSTPEERTYAAFVGPLGERQDGMGLSVCLRPDRRHRRARGGRRPGDERLMGGPPTNGGGTASITDFGSFS